MKILIMRLDERLGNLLLTTPLLSALRAHLPRAVIHMMVARRKQDIVNTNPAIDCVIPFEKRWLWTRPWHHLALVYRLRHEHYDWAIDASHAHAYSRTHAAFMRLCGAIRLVGHDKGHCGRFYHQVIPVDLNRSEIELKLSLLEPLGIPGTRYPMAFYIDESRVRDEIHAFCEQVVVLPPPRIGWNVGARKSSHRLSPDFFDRVATSKVSFIPLWGPGEEEVLASYTRSAFALVPPSTSVHELAYLLSHLDGVITGDTGLLHLSVALGVPTAQLITFTEAHRWGHDGSRHLVIPSESAYGESQLTHLQTWIAGLPI